MNIDNFIKNDTLEIIVHPNSSKNELLGFDEQRNAVKINIKAPAEDNKANIEIIKFFTKLTKRKVKILSGMTSKKKILRFL